MKGVTSGTLETIRIHRPVVAIEMHSDQNLRAASFEYNQLIILEHASKQVPHCVTTVEPYAREPRMMLVGFLS